MCYFEVEMRESVQAIEEINGLFNLSIVPGPDEISIATLLEKAIEGQSDPNRRSNLVRLVQALSSSKSVPHAGFVRDLMEILFLKREERSEYVNNKEAYKPFVISKILLEYAVKARQIDTALTSLTKSFCATKCDRLPKGCCVVLGYDLGLVPDRMMELQEIEARLNGWLPPKREDKCRFHGPNGCHLNMFKSPACIGFLCEALQHDLRTRFKGSSVDGLMVRLAAFRNCDIDRTEVFNAMDELLKWGKYLKVDETEE